MKVEMVMPQMGESIAEGTILKWLKKEGDVVEKDENILEISTDKVDSEIPSPAPGKIVALLAAEGDTVPVGQVIAHIETDVSASVEVKKEPPPQPKTQEAPPPATDEPKQPPAAAPVAPKAPAPGGTKPVAPVAPVGPLPPRDDAGRFYSPLVRSIAQAEGVALAELAQVPGSGVGGRVTKDDIIAYVERKKGAPAAIPQPELPASSPVRVGVAPSAPPSPPSPIASPGRGVPMATATLKVASTRQTPEGPVDVVPMDHIRQKIAEHMVRSKATSPHVASVTEVDMTRIVRYREANKAAFEAGEGFKLTFTPFFVLATVRALKEFPFVNASVEGTDILVKRFINIGIAVATDYGLMVPVLRGADSLNFLGIARGVSDLATRARAKQLKPDEAIGGTFSITNMGTVGTLFGIPVIAQPQVGILGLGAIQKRPVVRDDAIAIREMMYMCLSYDHRIVDGAMGGSFVERVAYHLETMELA